MRSAPFPSCYSPYLNACSELSPIGFLFFFRVQIKHFSYFPPVPLLKILFWSISKGLCLKGACSWLPFPRKTRFGSLFMSSPP